MTDGLQPVFEAIDQDFEAAVERLRTLLAMPSISTDPAYREATAATAAWLSELLAELGFAAAVRPTGGHPMVVAHHPGPAGRAVPHVLYYGHYDVQPPEPLDLWQSPPFAPVVREGRHGRQIVARGAVDDKGQVMTFLEAFRAWRRVHGELPVRVSVFLEGEEECGSPSLEPFLAAHRDELAADLCVLSDTGMWNIDTPAIVTSLRGLMYAEVTLHGATRDLHSGLYGGAVPNPLNLLARLLAELHDEAGRVRLPGFYDGVAAIAEADAWRALDFDEAAFLGEVGLEAAVGEAGYGTLERLWARPTLDINGISGGYAGPGAKTVIPARASAKLSCRLVPGQDPAVVFAALGSFLEARTPPGCRLEVRLHSSAPAFRAPADSAGVQAAGRALARVFGKPPVLMGMGGSVPAVEAIKRLLGVEACMMGFGLAEDRIHAPNEKFELRCLAQGMRSHAALLAELAALAPEQLRTARSV